jgi:hypothetical protein
VSMTGVFGRASTSIDGTLTTMVGPFTFVRSASVSDALTSVGDLYPMATLKWNQGVNNFMVYTRGDIPVGAYDANRLSNIGIGHGAIDAGAGYTYFDPTKGHELSAVAGLTYNFKNPTTDYSSRLGRVSVPVQTASRPARRISVRTDRMRQRWRRQARLLPIARSRRMASDWIHLSGWRDAGISQPERILRIRRRQQAARLERVALLRDLAADARCNAAANSGGVQVAFVAGARRALPF